MLNSGKKRTDAQITGDEAVKYICNYCIPKEWVVRELSPDYGIDLDIELFEKDESICWTLGEHVFVQAKGTYSPNYGEAKFNNHRCQSIKFSLEVSELELIEKMGSAFSVLLILVDLHNNRAFHICLNDYIAKVLPLQNPHYRKQKVVTIYLPVENELGSDCRDVFAWYGKKIKIYSMLTEMLCDIDNFAYMSNEKLIEYGRNFVSKYKNYDIWRTQLLWPGLVGIKEKMQEMSDNDMVLSHQYQFIKLVAETENLNNAEILEDLSDEPINAMIAVKKSSINALGEEIRTINGMFQECCREWFMPNLELGVYEE